MLTLDMRGTTDQRREALRERYGLADALVESGLLFLDLLMHCKQSVDDRTQHVLIEQATYVVSELSADRAGTADVLE